MYQPIFEITPVIEQHFESPLRVKAEATVEAIALSKSINQATPQQQVELAKASGWGTLTDIWVKANHQGNTWQHRCHEQLSQLLTQTEIQAAKSATSSWRSLSSWRWGVANFLIGARQPYRENI
jgi:hypothetical protein